jgi:serine/threonine protein kinase
MQGSLGDLSAPKTIDRYILLEVVGAGTMGVVNKAYDPDLDRKIALKLLRTDVFGGRADAELCARLLREAKAMARLSHPLEERARK